MASNSQRPSKAERTASAREQAQKMHAAQEAADKRKSLFIKLGVLVAVLAVIALVVALVLQKNSGTVADTGAVPFLRTRISAPSCSRTIRMVPSL